MEREPPLAQIIPFAPLPRAEPKPSLDDLARVFESPRAKKSSDAIAVPLTSQVLSLDKNLALMAGAGAGKTYNLVTLCLHLLAGARHGHSPIPPAQLAMLTFTDKAAAELRARLRERLDALALGEAQEPELRESFATVGREPPSPDFWRRVRDDLGAATIGTFHSLCVQLLRRAPGGFGVDPAFVLLDEHDATALLHDTAERLVLDALEADEAPVVELCREFGFTGDGYGRGLVDFLRETFTKVREEGISPLDIAISSEAAARESFHNARAELEAMVELTRRQLPLKDRAVFGPVLDDCLAALCGMTVENFLDPARFRALRSAVQRERSMSNKERLKDIKWRVTGNPQKKVAGLGEFFGACLVVPHERAFIDLLGRLETRHREELSKKSALDFSELLIRTRDLLRDWPHVRAEVQDRFRALLVDEFQDTNRLQLELVTLIAEKRDGSPRPLSRTLGGGRASDVISLPVEPAFLCAVGDRKQSIYEFRGADVSVFGVLAAHLERHGGARAHLKRNWRSAPRLLTFFNRLFARVMRGRADDARDYEVAYDPEGDDLEPQREQRVEGAAVERLVYAPTEDDDAERCRFTDADAVARHVRALLSPTAQPMVVGKDGAIRRPRGGDIAILFRRFTYLETYRQALTRYGIPHRVIRGRGFYGAQEVLDLASLLALVANPHDALSLAAVLRSPLVALSDASLFKLALKGNRLSLKHLDVELPADEAARLANFRALYPRLRNEKDRLGIRALLEVALAETGYRVAVAGTPFGEQALVNLDKLLDLARRWDQAGTGDVSAFAAEILALADGDPTEAQADILDREDPRAVHLCTIHQAKGLEWPVVFVPDLCARRMSVNDRILFDRQKGLAIKPWMQDEEVTRSPRYLEIQAERTRREKAEYERLLYVALTRARERLVVSGAGKGTRDTWWDWIDAALAQEPSIRELVRDLDVQSLAAPSPEAYPETPATAEQDARVERIVQRVRAPVPLAAKSLVLPVTHLQDFHRCPRRYLYSHQVGLSEYPVVFDFDEDAGEGRAAGDSRFKGTVAHRLLERVPLGLVGQRGLRRVLEELIWEDHLDPKGSDGREILSWVERFLETKFARKLASVDGARVHRELPFLLQLKGDDGFALHLKGQIDLLFEDDDGAAVVIDYKASVRPPTGLDSYGFQLGCYALAARHFVKEGVAVRTGIAFLRDKAPEPELSLAPPAPIDLVALARELLARRATQEWPGRERPTCEAMGCGYTYRCHPKL